MATENYKSAIIGLDAQFENQQGIQTDIDRVERALYLGKILGKEQGKSLAFNCMSAVERMALANQVSVADIKVIVLTQSTAEHVIAIESDIENAIVVSSLAKALQQIDVLIAQNALVALVGVSDKQNETDASQKLATISFDQAFAGYQPCQGVAALLFAPVNFVQANSNYVYSWLKGFSAGNDVEAVIACALDNAQVNATAIDLLEVSALADERNSLLEAQGLLASYALNNALNTAISCARSVTGEGEGFSQVLGLLRTVVALQQRYIPAITDWQQPLADKLANWQNSSFYLPTESRPWYPNQDGSAHIAAYSCLAANDDYCHVVLAENKITLAGEKHPSTDIRDNGFIACSDAHLVLITGDSEQHLLTKLAEIEDKLIASNECNSDIVKKIASNCFEQFNNTVASHTISLLCESKEELAKEIQSAKSGIPVALSKQEEWRTPKGSFFTPVPVNKAPTTGEATGENNISFLYPGIGATYVGLGRDLFHLFPEIHQDVANLADDIGASLKDTLLNPRSIIRPDFKTLKQLDLNLRGKLADIAEAGVGFACVFTKVFENVFKVKADFATGYSMGEVSMYAALGAWQQPGLMSARLANSDTFNQRLCGDLLTLREHWGLPEPSQTNNELIWETYTIKATLDEVIAASEGEERVYCTIVNTPDSLLLGGYPADCLRVIKQLGVRAMPLNMANAIHSAPAKIEYNDMVELYTMDVTERLKTKMYSSSCYLPVPQMSKAIAHSVAKCLCDRVDFPRLINTMHDKGARVFIEMGPGRSLCSWVDKMLGDEKSHVAVPVNAKGTSDELTYFRAIAKLVSHGIKLDLNRLFNGSIIVKKPQA
jgi:PfaB family protein